VLKSKALLIVLAVQRLGWRSVW